MGEAAAKEPTMEDILSSIRKIIAEEDGGSDKAVEPARSSAPAEAAPASERGSLQELAKKMATSDGSAESSRAGSETKAPVAETKPVSSGSSFADLAANVKETTSPEVLNSIASEAKAMAASETPVHNEPAPEPATPAKMANSLADIAAGLQESEPETVAVEPEQPPVPVANTAPEPASEMNQPETAVESPQTVAPVEAEKVEERAAEAPVPQAISAPAPTREEAEFKGALMSPSSDNSVSGSFDRLKRSVMDDLDAKTEAILRPMLREWLDENLPNMVERMVREEIERVARGI